MALRAAPRDVRPAGFAFHVYCAGSSSAAPDAESRGPRYRECARENDPRAFENAERTARALGGPPLFDEFGDSQDKKHVERLIEEADSRRMGWLYWGYKDCGSRYLRLRSMPRARRVSVRVAPGRCPPRLGG